MFCGATGLPPGVEGPQPHQHRVGPTAHVCVTALAEETSILVELPTDFPTTRGQAPEWDCCAIIGLRAGAIGIMATERANYAFNSSFSSIFGMSGANLDLRFVTLPYVVIHYRVRQQNRLPFRRYDMFVKLVSH